MSIGTLIEFYALARLTPTHCTDSAAALTLHRDGEGVLRLLYELVSLRIGKPTHDCGDLHSVELKEEGMIVLK
jgi:hypothetical protein